MTNDTMIEAAKAGARDGLDEVRTVLAEQGRDVVIATLAPGHLAWSEAASDAGAHRLAGVPDALRGVYYDAYDRAAIAEAERIRDAVAAESR